MKFLTSGYPVDPKILRRLAKAMKQILNNPAKQAGIKRIEKMLKEEV